MKLNIFSLGHIIKNDKVISHRSIIKILFNPILRRFFGIAIGSQFDNNKFVNYSIIKQNKPTEFTFLINFEYDEVIFKNIL